jgi:hypothetical protein
MVSVNTMESVGRAARASLAFIAVVQLGGAVAGAQAAAEPYVPKELVATEARQLATAAEGIAQYLQKVASLEKQTTVSRADLDAVQASADSVKRSLSASQTAMRAVVGKLKAAGKWTPELDAYVVRQLRAAGVDPRVGEAIQRLGGYRAVADRALAEAAGVTAEVDGSVAELRAKSIARMLLQELTGRRVQCVNPRTTCLYIYTQLGAMGVALMLSTPVLPQAVIVVCALT